MSTRLTLAKAALEEARTANDRANAVHVATCLAMVKAAQELTAAEREAALPSIPPALLEVAREVRTRYWPVSLAADVHEALARSHSIDPARLRDALEAGK